ncbi:MAG TPA: retropepsin-like aspartic protease [Gallionella sp.]
MRKNIAALLSLIILAFAGKDAWAASVYKCRNPQGELIYQGTPCSQDTLAVSSWETAVTPAHREEGMAVATASGTYVVKQGDNGHYFLDGTINGKPLTFLVDTGATAVSLPREIAYLAGMSCEENLRINTANGSASVCLSAIATLKLGPFTLKNVPATIVPNLDQPLLGMNVLQQFKIEQENGEMKISGRSTNPVATPPAAVPR